MFMAKRRNTRIDIGVGSGGATGAEAPPNLCHRGLSPPPLPHTHFMQCGMHSKTLTTLLGYKSKLVIDSKIFYLDRLRRVVDSSSIIKALRGTTWSGAQYFDL